MSATALLRCERSTFCRRDQSDDGHSEARFSRGLESGYRRAARLQTEQWRIVAVGGRHQTPRRGFRVTRLSDQKLPGRPVHRALGPMSDSSGVSTWTQLKQPQRQSALRCSHRTSSHRPKHKTRSCVTANVVSWGTPFGAGDRRSAAAKANGPAASGCPEPAQTARMEPEPQLPLFLEPEPTSRCSGRSATRRTGEV